MLEGAGAVVCFGVLESTISLPFAVNITLATLIGHGGYTGGAATGKYL